MKKNSLLIIVVIGIMIFTACSNGTIGTKEKEAYNVGETVKTEKVSEEDDESHDIKYKVTKIERNQNKVKAAINEYNTSGRGATLPNVENKKVEYAIAYYQAVYPTNFPADGEYGITDVAIEFEIVNSDGEKTINVDNTNYKNLEKTWEIGYDPRGYDFYPGDTYKGAVVFLMVKDYNKYLLKEGSHYIKGK